MVTSRLNVVTTPSTLLSQPLVRLIRFNQYLFLWLLWLPLRTRPNHITTLLKPGDIEPGLCYVIAANHQSMIDPFVICCALASQSFTRLAPFRYFAHNGLFDRIMRPILLVLGAFPTGPDRHYAYGLGAAQTFLAHHQTVVIFPEGRRTLASIRPRSGVKVLAENPRVRVIPAHIQWRRHGRFGRSFRLTIGQPIDAQNLSARQIMNRIYKLPL